jgi:hypothetical protein
VVLSEREEETVEEVKESLGEMVAFPVLFSC